MFVWIQAGLKLVFFLLGLCSPKGNLWIWDRRERRCSAVLNELLNELVCCCFQSHSFRLSLLCYYCHICLNSFHPSLVYLITAFFYNIFENSSQFKLTPVYKAPTTVFDEQILLLISFLSFSQVAPQLAVFKKRLYISFSLSHALHYCN